MCCGSWDRKESDTTEQLNRTELKVCQGGTNGKEQPANAGDIRDMGSIPGLERSPGGGHDNPLHYSCLENPMDTGAW